MAKALKKFIRGTEGVAAMEFALVVPIMIALLFGTVEIGNLYLAYNKIGRATHMGAELGTRAGDITPDERLDILDAMTETIKPFPDNAEIVLTHVTRQPGSNNASVDWSVGHQRGSFAVGSTFALPNGLLEEGESAVIADMDYRYTPVLGDFIVKTSIELNERAVLRPRPG